jgi:outer membrane protein OmpA-like peptidoglycan-associated protein
VHRPLLKDQPALKVYIVGHTDMVGATRPAT